MNHVWRISQLSMKECLSHRGNYFRIGDDDKRFSWQGWSNDGILFPSLSAKGVSLRNQLTITAGHIPHMSQWVNVTSYMSNSWSLVIFRWRQSDVTERGDVLMFTRQSDVRNRCHVVPMSTQQSDVRKRGDVPMLTQQSDVRKRGHVVPMFTRQSDVRKRLIFTRMNESSNGKLKLKMRKRRFAVAVCLPRYKCSCYNIWVIL